LLTAFEARRNMLGYSATANKKPEMTNWANLCP